MSDSKLKPNIHLSSKRTLFANSQKQPENPGRWEIACGVWKYWEDQNVLFIFILQYPTNRLGDLPENKLKKKKKQCQWLNLSILEVFFSSWEKKKIFLRIKQQLKTAARLRIAEKIPMNNVRARRPRGKQSIWNVPYYRKFTLPKFSDSNVFLAWQWTAQKWEKSSLYFYFYFSESVC